MNIKNEFAIKYGSISLSKFLSRYYSFTGDRLKNAKHKEIKTLFPNLKVFSFEDFKNNKENLELLRTGKVLIVDDGYDVVAYYTPDVYDEVTEFNREEVKNEIDDHVYDYTSMNEYDLRCLLRRKFNSYRNQCCARRELNNRGIVLHKKYNRSKIKNNKMEGY